MGFQMTSKNGLEVIRRNPSLIKKIKNPTDNQIISAMQPAHRDFEFDINWFKNPSKKVIRAFIKAYPKKFSKIKNPSDELKLYAISCGAPFSSIKNPTEKMLFELVKYDRSNFLKIKNPSFVIQKYVIKKSWNYIRCIKNPSYEIEKLAIDSRPDIAVILEIKNPSDKAILHAINANPSVIWYMTNMYDDIPEKFLLAAVKKDGSVIKYIIDHKGEEFLSHQIKMEAVKNSPYSIAFLDNPCEDLQIAACEASSGSILYINNPTEYVKLAYGL